jgi:cytochrome b6-f complex iron-sulfur subunit
MDSGSRCGGPRAWLASFIPAIPADEIVMADRKKMSVADMIAAAKKADGGGASPDDATPAAEEAAAASESTPAAPSAPSAKPALAKAAGGGRMSVAEMLAAARSGDAGGAAKPAAAAPAEKKATPPKPAAKPAAAEKATPAAPVDRDTASILAAAKKGDKAGPMSKAEAAAKEKADPVAKEKPKVFVPPMPAKPAYALPKPVEKPKPTKAEVDESRRSFLNLGFWMLGAVSALWTLASVKFLFPNVRREPPSKFKVGFPDAFAPGQVQTKFIPQFGVWVVNTEFDGQQQIFALKSVCTHLGCTPNWLEAEQKFKCPCHGSGFYKDGVNFEGPAPRPLERYAIRIADDGQIEIDKSRTFQEEMGQWQDASSFIPV